MRRSHPRIHGRGRGKAGTEVVLYNIVDGDHGWPNGRRGTVRATKLIWEFFKTHGRGSTRGKKDKNGKNSKSPKRRAKK